MIADLKQSGHLLREKKTKKVLFQTLKKNKSPPKNLLGLPSPYSIHTVAMLYLYRSYTAAAKDDRRMSEG